MGNVKGKNKENNDTTKNEPIKAGSTHTEDVGGIFGKKAIAIRNLILKLLSQRKEQKEQEEAE